MDCLAGRADDDTFGRSAPNAVIRVDARQVVNHVTPWMTGSCIEDVNHEIYGGLYDQKIFGESFEEPPPGPTFAGWTAYGGVWRPAGPAVRSAPMPGAKLVREGVAFADGDVEADSPVVRCPGRERRAACPGRQPRRRRRRVRRLRGQPERA